MGKNIGPRKEFLFKATETSVSKDIADSLNRYQMLAEITNDIILFVDLDGRIVDVNKAAVSAYGYTYEELCQMNIKDLRLDPDLTKKQLDKANKAGIIFETKHRRKDGRLFDVEVNSHGANFGHRRLLMSIVRDISTRKLAERKLQEQEELFRTVFEQSSFAMAFCEANGKIIDVNPMFENFLGRSAEELKRLGWINITHPEDREKDNENLQKLRSGEIERFTTTKRYLKPDGSVVWGRLSLAPLKYRDNKINLAMIEDITERLKADQVLKESERSKTMLLSNLPGMAYRCNYDQFWTMQFVSDGCLSLTGYKPIDLIDNRLLSYNDLIVPAHQQFVWERWAQILPVKGIFKEEYAIITQTGEIKWVFEQGQGIYDEKGRVVALEGLIIDITDRKKKEDEILYLSYHDVLTGLYNRRYFEKMISELDEEASLPLSVIIGDINGLKHINDALGRASGDKLIIAMAKILKSCIRKKDILARTGGGDFSILMPGLNSEEVSQVMEEIELACKKFESEAVYYASISLGAATKTVPNEDIHEIVKHAEDNMYQQKMLQEESFHSSAISSIKASLAEKSHETEEHAKRLVVYSRAIGKRLNLSNAKLNDLELISTLHDIGKIGIPDHILNKPGKLTEEEFAIIKTHPEIGYRIAKSTPGLKRIAHYILCHHERFDGKGYPKKLQGEDIPLLSRIIAVVDAFDAMTEDRPYRQAMSREEATAEIKQNAGTQFDPQVANIFLDIMAES